MNKAVLISIRPEWCEKIINGQKTIEVRKTRPKMDTPFKCYIYKCGNGKVIGEFLCDEIININGAGRIPSDAARPTCLEPAELHQYLGAATGFGWHISNLKIYDHPRDLWEFTGLRETKFGEEPGQSPDRRRAGGMWRKNYGTIDRSVLEEPRSVGVLRAGLLLQKRLP